MPRSITRPQTGSIVWYFAAAPPAAAPIAAIVIKSISGEGSQGVGGPAPTFNLALIDPVTAAVTAALAVPFYYGTRPASGAWCTMIRPNEPAPGSWPSLTDGGALAYALHDVPQDQKAAATARLMSPPA